MNLYDPTGEQPDYKRALMDALSPGAGMQSAPKLGGMEQGGVAGPMSPEAKSPYDAGAVSAVQQVAQGVSGADPAASGYSPIRGAKDGQKSVLLGYDRAKLDDPNYSTGKYNNEVKAFVHGLDHDVGAQRGGLNNMAAYLQNEEGYKNARVVGDDKIDFDGDGPLPPIDVVRGGDNALVFQDPRGVDPNAGGGASAAPQGGGMFGGSSIASLLQGNAQNNIGKALGAYPASMDDSYLQKLIAALGGQQ